MKAITKAIIIFSALLFNITSKAQNSFKTVNGAKANYILEIPSGYSAKPKIGANIDLKYVNSEGASIITTVNKLPDGVIDENIDDMNNTTDQQIINLLNANGLESISIIKKGFLTVNNIKSYYIYYKDETLYYHTISQFKGGKVINLTYTCEYAKKDSYMAYIFRVTNALKHF